MLLAQMVSEASAVKVAGCWLVWLVHEEGSGQCSRGEDCSQSVGDHILVSARSVLDPGPGCRR
jgi:hypothetical protein